MTNALNVVADAFGADAAALELLPIPADVAAPAPLDGVFDDIRSFYARGDVPLPFRLASRDPAYAADLWAAVKQAFADRCLTRRLKEALAFAVSLTSRSPFGTRFHLGEMRRLGVTEASVNEVLGVAQMFS